ncbi:MAG: GNAT family N-acetyltransferase [Methylacidiphilales bacterium]|nr:GNAT family N-acetyltransferase [Candidatus Methylacidiphilales bacterium]
MQTYKFKRSFAEDNTLSPRLFNLLENVFPGLNLSGLAEQARKLGGVWEDVSTPFVKIDDDGTIITHIGVLEIPMRIMGEDAIIGGIHAVSTHPEYRRQGYYREVMKEVLDYCDRTYKTLILTTAQPELYQPFGFRVIPEHSFQAKFNSPGGINGLRSLDITNSDDVQLIHRLLETRIPVSNIVGVFHQKALFLVNECTRPLYYFPNLDTLACLEIQDNQLKLFDLVTANLNFPTIKSLLGQIPQPIEEISIYFSPDYLQVDTQAVAETFEGDSLLMVRGIFPADNQQFTLPRSARC